MLSALRPRACTVLQSVERRRGFGRRGVVKHLLFLIENNQKAESMKVELRNMRTSVDSSAIALSSGLPDVPAVAKDS